MSLKNLVKQAKKATIKNTNGGVSVSSGTPSFQSLIYGLHYLTPKANDLRAILTDFLALMDKNPEPTETDKKRLILAFFRLAFSQDARAKGVFHPSEISTETQVCERKMYFQKAEVPQDATYVSFTADNRMMRLCDLGTMVHLYVQDNLDRLGILIDFEVQVSAPDLGVEGKADGLIDFYGLDDLGKFYEPEEMVLEVKTINDYAFKYLRKAKDEHLKQASIYGAILKKKRICFLYYNKNTSEHKIFVQDVDYKYFTWFEELASGVIKLYNSNVRQSRSKDLNLHNTIPTRICHSRTNQRAMNCAFADYCFNLLK